MAVREVDIVIVGGGLIGASLCLALLNHGYSVLLIETVKLNDLLADNFDARSIALSQASIAILRTLKVWPYLADKAGVIKTIQISEQGRFGNAHLKSDSNFPLGYVLELPLINKALYRLIPKDFILEETTVTALDAAHQILTINQADVTITLKAKLIIAADGSHSSIRQLLAIKALIKPYDQQALIANLILNRSHACCAYERFTTFGAMALLPLKNNKMTLITSVSTAKAQELLTMPAKDFLTVLQKTFGYRAGRFVELGQRHCYTLNQIITQDDSIKNIVFIGNAAQTLHPIAGQGFNLGLRDVATLAQCIVKYGLEDDQMLINYRAFRQKDKAMIIRLTNGLLTGFATSNRAVKMARNLALFITDNSNFLQNTVSYYVRGFAGVIPDLACGIALERSS